MNLNTIFNIVDKVEASGIGPDQPASTDNLPTVSQSNGTPPAVIVPVEVPTEPGVEVAPVEVQVLEDEHEDELNIGDDVFITGNVKFSGATGKIVDFGRDKHFVVVDLYNHGKHSFHSSNVEFNDYAGSEEEENDWQERDNIHDYDMDEDMSGNDSPLSLPGQMAGLGLEPEAARVATQTNEQELDEVDFGQIANTASNAWTVWNFIKQHGIPVGLFAAAVGAHGLTNALRIAQQDEGRFKAVAKKAATKINPDKLEGLTAKLNNWFVKTAEKMKLDNPHEMAADLAGIGESNWLQQPVVGESCVRKSSYLYEGLTKPQAKSVKLWESAGYKLAEAKLTPQQISNIFASVEQAATAGGNNRTMLGKGKDAASAVNTAWEDLKTKIQNSTPIKNVDAYYDQAAEKLKQATGGDQGVMQYVQKYRDFAKKHPVAQSFIYSALIAAAGLSGAGLGGAAALGLFKMVDRLLQGDKFSSAAYAGAKTGAMAYGASKVADLFKGTQPLPGAATSGATSGLNAEQIQYLKDLGAQGSKMVVKDGSLWARTPDGLLQMLRPPMGSSADAMLKIAQSAAVSEAVVGTTLTNKQVKQICEGLGDWLKGKAQQATQWAQTKGHNLTTKITADKLQQAWKAAGSTTDSNELYKVLVGAGVAAEAIAAVYNGLKIPVPGARRLKETTVGEGMNKLQDLRDALARHEEKALAANKAGNDEAVKVHQRYINKIKTKMGKLAKLAESNGDVDMDKWMKEYEDREDRNYHSENALAVAELVGDKDEIQIMQDILTRNNQRGYTSPADSMLANKIQSRLWPKVQARMKLWQSKLNELYFANGNSQKIGAWNAPITNEDSAQTKRDALMMAAAVPSSRNVEMARAAGAKDAEIAHFMKLQGVDSKIIGKLVGAISKTGEKIDELSKDTLKSYQEKIAARPKGQNTMKNVVGMARAAERLAGHKPTSKAKPTDVHESEFSNVSTEKLQAFWDKHKEESPAPAFAQRLRAVAAELKKRRAKNSGMSQAISESDALVNKLRKAYDGIQGIDPASPTYKKLISLLDSLSLEQLQTLVNAKIKFVSGLARNRVNRRAQQVNELSPDTLRNYKKAAVKDADRQRIAANNNAHVGNKSAADAHGREFDKRVAGLGRANKSISKQVNEDGGYYYEQLAQKMFDLNPNFNIKGRADDLINAAWPEAVKDLGKKRAQWEFNYDEDFISDFVSAYGELQRGEQGVAESDISGLLAASALNKEFLVVINTAEKAGKKFKVKAQSARVAQEKIARAYPQSEIVSVKEITEGVAEGGEWDEYTGGNPMPDTDELDTYGGEHDLDESSGTEYRGFDIRTSRDYKTGEVVYWIYYRGRCTDWGTTTLNGAKKDIDRMIANGYLDDPDEAARKKQRGVAEAKGLNKRVRVVKTGETGTIRQVKHGAFKGAPKSYFVDLDNGKQADNLPASALRLIKEQGVAEGWGAEKQQRDLDAANARQKIEYEAAIERHKDDPEFLDYLRMFLINGWGGYRAEKGAEEWIAKGKPLPEWFVKMKAEKPDLINTIFDRL